MEGAEQHGQSDPLAAPQLGPCASSGRAWWHWPARHSQEAAGPLGAQPLPRVLELAASKAADFTAVDHAGMHFSISVKNINAQAAAGLTSAAPGEHNLVDPVFPRALRWLSATTVDDVRGLERDEVSQVDGPSSADRRKLWLFCVAQREALEAAVADATRVAAAEVRALEAAKRAASRRARR